MEAPPFARVGIAIDVLELSVRAQNALSRWRRDLTVQDLMRVSDEDLRKIPHMGPKSIKEIRDAINAVSRAPNSENTEIMLWVERHRTLVLALMRGEAVITPTERPQIVEHIGEAARCPV